MCSAGPGTRTGHTPRQGQHQAPAAGTWLLLRPRVMPGRRLLLPHVQHVQQAAQPSSTRLLSQRRRALLEMRMLLRPTLLLVPQVVTVPRPHQLAARHRRLQQQQLAPLQWQSPQGARLVLVHRHRRTRLSQAAAALEWQAQTPPWQAVSMSTPSLPQQWLQASCRALLLHLLPQPAPLRCPCRAPCTPTTAP